MPIIYLVQRCLSQGVSFSNLEVIIILSNGTHIELMTMSFFYENKCCGRESVGVSWIWTFLSSRSSWGVRVPPELLPLLLQLDVTKWPTTIDRQKNKYKVTTIKLIKMTKNKKKPWVRGEKAQWCSASWRRRRRWRVTWFWTRKWCIWFGQQHTSLFCDLFITNQIYRFMISHIWNMCVHLSNKRRKEVSGYIGLYSVQEILWWCWLCMCVHTAQINIDTATFEIFRYKTNHWHSAAAFDC